MMKESDLTSIALFDGSFSEALSPYRPTAFSASAATITLLSFLSDD
jgi:hypothetical protein